MKPVANREIERSRGCPATGSDAVVMGRKRAGDGGVGANQRLNCKAKKKDGVSKLRRQPALRSAKIKLQQLAS